MNDAFAEMFGGKELFVAPKAFRAWLAEAKVKAQGLGTPDAVQAAITAYTQRTVAPVMVGDIALIDVCGPITYKSSWLSYYFGGASIQDLQQQFRVALADPAVKTILFRIDSPGGVVDMMPEFADEVFAARGQGKALIGVADLLVASCAYWLGSQLETLYATTSAQIGAIGVYCEHDDISGMLEKAGIKITLIAHGDNKVDGNPYEPLSDTARADMQASVDEIGGWFDAAVARGRGVKTSVVLETFGQGKVFRGKKAKSLGMVDQSLTFSQVLAKLTKGRGGAAARAAAASDGLAVDGDAAMTPVAAKAKAVCQSCAKSSCACTEDECPVDCPTCSPECPCVQDEELEAKKAAARDEAAILAGD